MIKIILPPDIYTPVSVENDFEYALKDLCHHFNRNYALLP
jgi:hypothetical protein